MCELFDQYRRQGIQQGIQGTIAVCKKLQVTFEATAEQMKEQYHLSNADTQRNMEQYW